MLWLGYKQKPSAQQPTQIDEFRAWVLQSGVLNTKWRLLKLERVSTQKGFVVNTGTELRDLYINTYKSNFLKFCGGVGLWPALEQLHADISLPVIDVHSPHRQ